jgi:thiamine-phosphate pyrophosphorylase
LFDTQACRTQFAESRTNPARSSPHAALPGVYWTVPHFDPDRLRILDANVNRAAEGLRVVEDYLRFALQDGHLAGRCKRIRHRLADIVTAWPAGELILSRDAAFDVGRPLKTVQELCRKTADDIATANLKRVQQALRSLEEWAKLPGSLSVPSLEDLRYQTYELESAIQRTRQSTALLCGRSLYLLVDGANSDEDFQRRIGEALDAGVNLFQLREKRLPDRELFCRGRKLMEMAHRVQARVIINDRIDLAQILQADGVHLGQDDLPVHVARRLLGPTALVGVSTHTLQQARQAVTDGASYIGVGPTFVSVTKSFDQLAGPALLGDVAAEIGLPAFAIGGINLDRLDEVIASGMTRVAVSSAIWGQAALGDACRQFLARLASAAPVVRAPDSVSSVEGPP